MYIPGGSLTKLSILINLYGVTIDWVSVILISSNSISEWRLDSIMSRLFPKLTQLSLFELLKGATFMTDIALV